MVGRGFSKRCRCKSDARTRAHSESFREMRLEVSQILHEVLWSAMRLRIAFSHIRRFRKKYRRYNSPAQSTLLSVSASMRSLFPP